ncbi:Mucin-4 [Myotis davidii]|uniref:Mucin-4 n=1 Tax=Myotis davidii TaxID=225400 RepID=L5MIC7_MYODS|nr:Mucin-4 [Myotis davidii]
MIKVLGSKRQICCLSVSLFPYGPRVQDQEFVRRRVDFTSPLFKPQIGFPFGSSLRDFLYFTDNGQIIFPESEYQIFSHPHPPLGGFTGRDGLAVVAPFWDDADFSSRKGTIFYQEYETLYDDKKPLVVQQVESWIENFANTWNYKARWTLKVTWINATAYPAQRTSGTNTYQAILSTDGSRSFALFLYQSGGMQWDVTQHLDNWALMGFSSGDGYYENSPLTSQPVWQKYRPDQFLNSNSEQELEPQDWCCRWNDKPSFCALYQQRRPRISCAGYRPLRPAWMFGDPHITTLDDATYTFNGLGDFLLVRARDGNSSFLLQGRTAQSGSAQATNFIAFAAQYNSSSLDPITVQWLLEPNDTIHVRLNNQTVTFEDQEIFNTTGVIMTRNGSLVTASLDGTVIISVTALSNILHTSCSLPEEYRDRTEGLLGVWNNNPEDDFKMPNGTTIPQESNEEMLFHYGMTWEINGTSLLGKRDDHLPSNFTPVFFSQLWNNNSLDKNSTSKCNGDKQCIYDTLATGNTKTGLDTRMLFRRYQQTNNTLHQYPPSIEGPQMVKAYKGETMMIQYKSSSKDVTFTLRNSYTKDFKLFVISNPFQVASCKCDNTTFGQYCERSKDLCDEQCFPNVKCIPGQGCDPCPPNLIGDGRHCTGLEDSEHCQNQFCPVNYCYNQGHCYISQTLDCQPTCTCPPAFTDNRCFLAGNNFTPTIDPEFPLRTIQLILSEEENATEAEVNASVAYRLKNLDVRAFLRNSKVQKISSPASGSLQQWLVISEFQYRPRGPVIHFLNTQLLDAVVEAFLLQAPQGRWKESEEPRNDVVFHPISRRDVRSLTASNVSTLQAHLKCNGYKGYKLVYSPQGGFTCVSPCSEGYCEHGGQCQHLPDGPRCSCMSFSIYTPWGERCEHLSMKLGAFFGILFGALGALLLLGAIVFAVHRFWCTKTRFSYPLDSES